MHKKFKKTKNEVFYYDLTKEQCYDIMYNELFETREFYNHVKEVCLITGIEEKKVLRVLISYFLNIMFFLNKTHKRIVKLNIYSFFSILINK